MTIKDLTKKQITEIGDNLWEAFTESIDTNTLTREQVEDYEEMSLEETCKLFLDIVKKYVDE